MIDIATLLLYLEGDDERRIQEVAREAWLHLSDYEKRSSSSAAGSLSIRAPYARFEQGVGRGLVERIKTQLGLKDVKQ